MRNVFDAAELFAIGVSVAAVLFLARQLIPETTWLRKAYTAGEIIELFSNHLYTSREVCDVCLSPTPTRGRWHREANRIVLDTGSGGEKPRIFGRFAINGCVFLVEDTNGDAGEAFDRFGSVNIYEAFFVRGDHCREKL
jgi:hypothetical protein